MIWKIQEIWKIEEEEEEITRWIGEYDLVILHIKTKIRISSTDVYIK